MKYSQLDTSGIPQYEEIPAWERFNALHMVKLTCQSLDQRLHGLQRCIDHASMQSVQIQAGAHTIFRTSADIDETPSQMIQLSTVEGGDLYFQDSSGVTTINHNSLLIFDTDSPYSMIFGKQMTMRSLLIPKKLVAEVSPEIIQNHRSLVATTTEFENLQDAIFAGHKIEVERIIRSAIPLSESEAAFQNAFTVIAKTYNETELTIGDIAADLHLSERQLARIFSARGKTIAREVLQFRLGKVAENLVDPKFSTIRINEVFYQNGFGSPSNGHRRFVERFGTTPGNFRKNSSRINESIRQ